MSNASDSDDEYTLPFAKLVPINALAIRAASAVYQAAQRNPTRYEHQAKFMCCKEASMIPLQTLLSRRHVTQQLSMTSSSSNSASSNSNYDDHHAPAEHVWPIWYSFSLPAVPDDPPSGWIAGALYESESSEELARIDLLISLSPHTSDNLELMQSHAQFQFMEHSGQFAVRPSNTQALVSVDTETKVKSFRLLKRLEHTVAFGELVYRLEYVIPTQGQAAFQRALATYFDEQLKKPPPNRLTSVSPSTQDTNIHGWTIKQTAGAGARSTVHSACNARGEVAACMVRSYYTAGQRERVNTIVNTLGNLRARLDESGAPGKEYVSRLRKALPSHGQKYILMQPLGITSFATTEFFNTMEQFHPQLFAQTIAGMAALHVAGFLHLDFKPANLVLTNSSPAKAAIIDLFDIIDMRLIERKTLPSGSPSGGTVGFLAPEREAKNSTFSFPVDIWALGTVGLQLLSGGNGFEPFAERPKQNPFKAFDLGELDNLRDDRCRKSDLRHAEEGENPETYRQRLRKQAYRHLAKLEEHAQGRSNSLEHLLSGMLALRAENRLTAAQALDHPWTQEQLYSSRAGKRPIEHN